MARSSCSTSADDPMETLQFGGLQENESAVQTFRTLIADTAKEVMHRQGIGEQKEAIRG